MKIVKSLKTTLSSPLTASATSVVLKKFVDLDGTELALSDFGDWGVIVIKQGDTVEMIKFSALAQSGSDTTCTLTVASSGRSIAPTYPYAGASTGLAFNAGAEVIVTNDPLTLSRFANLDVAGTFTKIMTFSALPEITAGNPVSANDVARKGYVDSVVAGIATTISVVVPGTAGETIAAGQLVYFDDATNYWKLCDADTATTVENVMLGMAQGAGTVGVAITNGVLLRGLDANQTGLTAGIIYYASNTAGGLSSSAGTKEVTIGFSYSTTQFYFNPRFDQQLTEDQQDALGSTTTPSATNKYLTQKDFQIGAEKYAASSAGSDTYAITLSPVPAAYVNGMIVSFKADVANTGAATLNVNTLGAVDITKLHDQALVTGDIEANQIVTVIYNSSTAKFQMISPIAQLPPTTFTNGSTTKADSDADAATTVIAHGLGATPKRVSVMALMPAIAANFQISQGYYDSGSQTYISLQMNGSGGVLGSGAAIVRITKDSSNYQIGTLTVDATNLTITWAKTGTPNFGTYNIIWSAQS